MTPIQLLQKAATLVRFSLKRELKAQGHYLTGGLENSMTDKLTARPNGLNISGTAAGYGGILDAGVASDKIPYGGPPTGAKTSKYIQGLQHYFMLRKGLSAREALSAAFATAKKHKEDGMPTLGSYGHSKSGQRLYFIERARERVNVELNNTVSIGLNVMFNDKFFKQKSEII